MLRRCSALRAILFWWPSSLRPSSGILWVPVAGHLSDRIGRKRMYMIGSVFVGIFGFICFALLDTKVPALMFIAIALSLLPATTCYGPPGGADRGKLHPSAALQRRLARLPARLDHCGWPLAVYRDGTVRHLSLELADRPLYPSLRDHRHHCDGAADGLHQQGHLRGIRKR